MWGRIYMALWCDKVPPCCHAKLIVVMHTLLHLFTLLHVCLCFDVRTANVVTFYRYIPQCRGWQCYKDKGKKEKSNTRFEGLDFLMDGCVCATSWPFFISAFSHECRANSKLPLLSFQNWNHPYTPWWILPSWLGL